MNPRQIKNCLAALMLGATSISAVSHAEEIDKKALTQEAKGIIKAFAGDLKSTLVQGMKAKGPDHAISLCNEKAPGIAEKHSAGEWQISRTSLKIRNPGNAPTEWQTQILESFEQRKANGEDVKAMAATHIQDGNFYLVKAIPTGPVCTVCHGKELNPAVSNRLGELYPNDKATGFAAGDIRGAFVVSKSLSQSVE